MPQWYIIYRVPLLMLQTVLGILVFAQPLRRRKHFWLRLVLGFFLAAALLRGAQFLVSGGDGFTESGVWRTVFVLGSHVLSTLLIWACYQESLWTVLFVFSSGAIAQDIAGTLKTVLKFIPFVRALSGDDLGILAVDLACYGGVYLVLAVSFRPLLREREVDFNNWLKALFSLLTLAFCITMARLTLADPARSDITILVESSYQILLGLFFLFFQFSVIGRAKLRHSVEAMQEIIHTQYDQFRQSRDSVDLVNEKYHDLKGLLDGYHGQISPEQMEQLRAKVDEYDVYVDTGNRVLDIVIAEKRAICNQRGIELTTLLDGAQLDFMEELDLYSLVSNALNNAIDAAGALPEGERFITLTAAAQSGMVTLHVENPYAGELVLEDDLPKTQRDERFHGFGMRSMRRIAEKYGGTLAAKPADGIFRLDIILFAP